jgi:predicted dehydrogenase
VPSERGPLGLRVLDAGKNFFSDKTPFTAHAQLEAARAKVKATGLKWSVFYSERIQNEAGVKAGELVKAGEIGRVVQLIGLGPHRLNAKERPDWFFRRRNYGGILCDIGSHQAEQFLFYAGARKARVVSAAAKNFSHPEYPEFEDYGEAVIEADNGARQFMRVDWLTPDGLPSWGDGRTIILGTRGYIELRKYLDLARDNTDSHLYIVNESEPRYIACKGTVGFPYFGELILDILNGTDLAMPQEHTFMAAELCLDAQKMADAVRAAGS